MPCVYYLQGSTLWMVSTRRSLCVSGFKEIQPTRISNLRRSEIIKIEKSTLSCEYKINSMRTFYYLLFLLLFLTQLASAQLATSQLQQIDSLFQIWNQPNHPGGTVGVMKNGKTLFLKAYGLASLDYLVPNSTETIYNTASVSKQFTSMGIVLLHLQGKLSVDDDIRKHIPELPDFGETITIRHLMHHTSGLRSLHALLGLAGWRSDDRRSNEDLYRFMERQQDLNFKPGEEYLYCNTGFMYLAKIMETVTEEKFAPWMKTSVFEPLGMIHTYVEDQYNRVVPQNATSYNGDMEEGFDRAIEFWDYVGSGNMHSTVPDLLKWMNNFSNPKKGWEEAFDMMQTTDPFNDGSPNNYAFGVGIGEWNGHKTIQHGGSIGGFRSNVIAFPEEDLSIAILTNFSSSDPSRKISQIAEILLDKKALSITTSTLPKPIRLKRKALETFTGTYWNDKDNYARKIYLKNDTLRYFRSDDNATPLIPIAKNQFMMDGNEDIVIAHFTNDANGRNMIISSQDETLGSFTAYEPIPSTEKELEGYTGVYYTPELETTYHIYSKEDQLFWHHARHGDFPMKRVKKDVLEGEYPFSIVKFKRNPSGEISGILVSNGRVRNLWMALQSKK